MKQSKKVGLIKLVNPLRHYLILVFTFAVLVCTLITFLIAFGAKHFEPMQRWVFIGFLPVFSLFALGLIVWLILRHAKKLAISKDDNSIEWENLPSEKQRLDLHKKVKELASIMNTPDEQLDDLRLAYIVAEDLALRKIQQEARKPILRHVTIGKIGFSAVNLEDGLVTCIHVSFVADPEIKQKKISELLKKLSIAKIELNRMRKGPKIRLLLVLVTQLNSASEIKLRSSLVRKFSATPVDVDIRLLDFQDLQRIYSD